MIRLRSAAVALVAGALLALPASAFGTEVFGSSLPVPEPGWWNSCSQACTAAQIVLPGAQVTSPIDGTITKFRLRTAAGSDPQMVRFRVLRSSTDGKNFTGVGTSAPVALPTTAGITDFAVNLPVQKGDYIGMDQLDPNKEARVITPNDAAFQGGWFPAIGDNATPSPSGNPQGSPPTRFEQLLQAVVEPEPQPPMCTTPGTFVATCPDPLGPPSVCGPGAPLPQCSFPTVLPTVCGPIGLGFPACALPQNYVMACGSLGTGLPQCPAAGNPILVCGPKNTILPECNFRGPIKGRAPIIPASGPAEIPLDLSCPPEDVLAAAAANGSQVSTKKPKTCRLDVALDILGDALQESLLSEAAELGKSGRIGAYWRVPENGDAWIIRSNRVVQRFIKPGVTTPFDRAAVLAELTNVDCCPAYQFAPPPFPGFASPGTGLERYQIGGSIESWVNTLEGAVTRYRTLEGEGKSSGSRARSAGATPNRPLVRKRLKVRRGRSRTKPILSLPRRVVKALAKNARRSSSKRVVPVRLIVVYRAKDKRPVARVVDFGLRVKKQKRPSRAG